MHVGDLLPTRQPMHNRFDSIDDVSHTVLTPLICLLCIRSAVRCEELLHVALQRISLQRSSVLACQVNLQVAPGVAFRIGLDVGQYLVPHLL